MSVSSMVALGLLAGLGRCFFSFVFLGEAEFQNDQGWNSEVCTFLLGGCEGLCQCCSSLLGLCLLDLER